MASMVLTHEHERSTWPDANIFSKQLGALFSYSRFHFLKNTSFSISAYSAFLALFLSSGFKEKYYANLQILPWAIVILCNSNSSRGTYATFLTRFFFYFTSMLVLLRLFKNDRFLLFAWSHAFNLFPYPFSLASTIKTKVSNLQKLDLRTISCIKYLMIPAINVTKIDISY